MDIKVGIGTYCMVDDEGCLECSYIEEPTQKKSYVPIESIPEGSYRSVWLANWITSGERGPMAGCAIDTDNHPVCWEPEEQNFWGESSPSPLEEVSMIANHERAPCAARVGGGAYCWGSGGKNLDADVIFTDIAITAQAPERTALSADGNLYSWNINTRWQSIVPGPFVAVQNTSLGVYALHKTSGLYYWAGSPGDSDIQAHLDDPSVQGTALCSYVWEPCVLDKDGSVYCIEEGQPSFDVPLVSLSCVYPYICGLTESGEGRCWSEKKGMWKLP